MFKRIPILLLALILLLQLSPVAAAYPAPSHGAQDGISKFEKEIPMSFTHRSAWRLAPENSLPAIYHSIAMGIDAVEVDVMLSKDGVLALMHDTTIDRNVVGYTGKVADYNWSQLKSMPLRPEQGGSGTTKFTMTATQAKIMNTLPNYASHYGKAAASGDTVNVARFDDCLDLMAIHGPRTMVTIDKCSSQAVFVACYKLLREKDMLGNAYFKISQSVSTLNTWATAAANAWNTAYPSDKITQADVKNSIIYMHVMGTPNESTLQAHLNNGTYLKAVEVTYNATNAANCESLITGSFDAFCDKNNIALYCSTISTGGWSGGRPDSEKTWAYMLGIGFDGIQTDRASELADYLYDYNRQRASSETIQAESFQNMSSVDAYFSLPLEADSSMNKVVNNLRNGEWLEYRNIFFNGKEYQLRLGVRGLLKGATLKFYIDSVSSGNLIGTYTLAADSAIGVKTINLSKTIPAGEHKLFVQASGTAGKDLANLDYFGFVRDAEYLYFDYTNTSKDQSRYNRKTYGNVNYDLATSWFTPGGRTDGTVVADGNISITVKAEDTTTYHYIETGTYWENHPLNYTAGPEDVCQVRLKIDNAVSSKTNGYGEFILFYGVDKSEINSKSVRVAFKMSDVVDKGFVSYTIPMDANWKGNITSIRPFVNQIQNASGKRAKITFDYIYIGPKSWMPEQNHLYFGFDNTNTDQMRYNTRPYGGLNFDLASNWWYQSSRTTPPSISDGAISFTVLPSDSTKYHYIQSSKNNTVAQYPLHFTPGDKDCCQVRLKIDDAVSTDTDGKTAEFNLFYGYGDLAPGEQRNDSKSFDLTKVVNKGYFTLLFPMDSSYYLDAEQITTIRPFVNKINSAPGKNATVTIDYVYVGPMESVPEPDNLLFHFTNTDTDIARYSSHSYGYRNFDRPTEAFWGTNATAQGEGTNYTNFSIDNAAGTAIVKVGDDLEGEKQPGPKFMTSTAYGVFPWNGRGGYAPLNYRPTKAEYFQIRFKLDNVVDTGDNTIQLEYHYDNAKGVDAIKYGDLNAPFTFKTGSYQVITVPLSSTFKNAAKITSFGVRFMNIKSADSAKLGTVTIDYMYVGTLAGLPTPAYTVTFVDAAGKTLATQLVNKGESATYDGPTPTKAYDTKNHYTFKSWDKALTNITANTTITAQYNAIAHSYTYSVVDATNHKASCSCGYSKNVAHSYTYKVTTAPTLSAAGVLTGTCSVCSGKTTVALPKIVLNDYDLKVISHATCTETGIQRYTWKNTTYGSYYFDITTAALGHSYTAKVTAPTCTAQGYTTHTCSRCSDSYKDTYTNATGHSYTYKATKNPTTAATGTLTGTCSKCSGTTTVTLPKLNTTDYTKTVTKAATCTASGTDSYKWKTTTYGSFTFTATTAALGHSYTAKVTAPTCTAQGYTTHTCSRCSNSYKDTYTNALGHNYTNYKATTAPTTSATGVLTGTCSRCSATTTVTLPKLNTTDYTKT
ncbi:MAG: hypothetical protein J6K89_00115, partial [Oscillospiraceae bacterium]|nr:hypothetical protein [Oscillospiraceae bacterium]